MKNRRPFGLWLAVVCVFVACQTDPSPDSGAGDSGRDAAPPRDSGTDPLDAPMDPDAAGDDSGPRDAPVGPDGGVCVLAADCQDGSFCNGYEACAPGTAGADARGCVAGTPPCSGGATCDDTAARCFFCMGCAASPDCDDGLVCNGNEGCVSGACWAGTPSSCDTSCVEPSGACSCTTAANCSDGLACNGAERCTGGVCQAGTPPVCASGARCEEAVGGCTETCMMDIDCSDGRYCNGAERCDPSLRLCRPGTAPCGPMGCNEPTDSCRCTTGADCDDGVWCTGHDTYSVELCSPGTGLCYSTAFTCAAGRHCNEATDRCTLDTCTTVADCGPGCFECTAGICADLGCACPPSELDADGDGTDSIQCGGNDCDDSDPLRYPGNTEVCDSADRDEDCDSRTVGVLDTDGDSFTSITCCNGLVCGNDCDDSQPGVRPDLAETCDGRDNDCDTITDEAVLGNFYLDRDMDGDGDQACGNMIRLCAGTPGYSTNGGDCDDGNTSIDAGSTSCDPSGVGARVCRMGVWEPLPCPPGTTCRPLPDGTGQCL